MLVVKTLKKLIKMYGRQVEIFRYFDWIKLSCYKSCAQGLASNGIFFNDWSIWLKQLLKDRSMYNGDNRTSKLQLQQFIFRWKLSSVSNINVSIPVDKHRVCIYLRDLALLFQALLPTLNAWRTSMTIHPFPVRRATLKLFVIIRARSKFHFKKSYENKISTRYSDS